MPKGKNTLTTASKYVLSLKTGLTKTFDGIFFIGNLKYFTMMQSSKEIIHKKHKRKNYIKSSWVVIMQMCPCDCGTNPVTPLLSFPMGVLSQEEMVNLPHMHPFPEKDFLLPRPPSVPRVHSHEYAFSYLFPSQEKSIAQEDNLTRHAR